MNKITLWQFMDYNLKDRHFVIRILLGSKLFRGFYLLESFLFGLVVGFGARTRSYLFAMVVLFGMGYFLDSLTVEITHNEE